MAGASRRSLSTAEGRGMPYLVLFAGFCVLGLLATCVMLL